MSVLLFILAGIVGLVQLVAFIFVLIAAFKDEIWKGLLCLICGIYALYYAVTEGDMIEYKGIPMGVIFVVCCIVNFVLGGLIKLLAPHT